MRISEIARQTGLSVPTIRYYEKVGLCPPIGRGTDGKRLFSAKDLDWLLLLASLRETGMPNSQMRDFASLYKFGNDTVCERKEVLLLHQKRLTAHRSQLDRCAAILAHKLEIYDKIIEDQS